MAANCLESNLKRLRVIGGDEREKLLRRLHQVACAQLRHPQIASLDKLRAWILTPSFLWPVNMEIIAQQATDLMGRGQLLDEPTALLLDVLIMPPEEEVADALLRCHQQQENNEWECFIHATHKFNLRQQELEGVDELKTICGRARRLFGTSHHQDSEGMIFLRDFALRFPSTDGRLNWNREEDRFHAFFIVFCHRWNLEGGQETRPVLSRTRVSFNAFGTVIFIPSYWSFDCRRDLKWSALTTLHRRRGAPKDGIKRGLARLERREESRQAKRWMKLAKDQGLKGEKLMDWVMGQLRWDRNTSVCRLYRLLKQP